MFVKTNVTRLAGSVMGEALQLRRADAVPSGRRYAYLRRCDAFGMCLFLLQARDCWESRFHQASGL